MPALERCVDGARLVAHAYVTSWNQSQLLTVHVVDGATAAYNIPMTHWVDGSHSAWSVGVALGVVMDRHAVLRTTYEVDAVEAALRSACTRTRPGEWGWRVCRLCREACVPSAAAADGIVGADSSRGFELLSAVAAACCAAALVRVVSATTWSLQDVLRSCCT